MSDIIFLNCWHLDILWYSSKQTVQNGSESVVVVSTKWSSSDSTAVTRSLIYIAVALDVPAFFKDMVARLRGKLGGDGCLMLITSWRLDRRVLFVLHVVRRSSL